MWHALVSVISFISLSLGVVAGSEGKEIAQIEAELAVIPSREKLLGLENYLEVTIPLPANVSKIHTFLTMKI